MLLIYYKKKKKKSYELVPCLFNYTPVVGRDVGRVGRDVGRVGGVVGCEVLVGCGMGGIVGSRVEVRVGVIEDGVADADITSEFFSMQY